MININNTSERDGGNDIISHEEYEPELQAVMDDIIKSLQLNGTTFDEELLRMCENVS